jgi:hypothetical protein
MAQPVLHAFQPRIVDPKPETPPQGALAWFARFASGALVHISQPDSQWLNANGVPVKMVDMAWAEYQRLVAEAHWYEK